MVEMQLIPCKQIRMPKGAKLSETTIHHLHDSIRTEGMYNPVVLRPDPDHTGDYLVVQGKHRFHVKSKLLKEDAIEARVFPDMDAAEAELATMTENACRNAPSGNKRLLLIQQWQEVFRRKYPDLIGKRAGGKARSQQRAEAGKVDGGASTDHTDPCSAPATHESDDATMNPPPSGQKRPATFIERVAASTGQSTSSAKRDIRIANGFTEDQLNLLDPLGVGKLDLLAILDATRDSENERAEVVNLVCSGMPTADAIREVTGLTEIKDKAGRTKQADTAEGASAKMAEDAGSDLPDDDWFATYCGEFAKLLGDPARFRLDAILFRHLSDARAAFRKRARKPFAAAREAAKGKAVGPFFFLLHRLLNASHPKDWLYCDQCKGSGRNESGPCKKCGEAGYFIKTEKYV